MKKRTYDTLVVGGSTAGCFAALSAARLGLRVLLVEARTYLGREFTATLRPWIGSEGWEDADDDVKALLKLGERPDPDGGCPGQELTLQPGHMKKWLLSRLQEAGIDVLFMSAPAGVLVSDGDVCGAVFGGKSGLLAITAHTVIDATDNGALARMNGLTGIKADRLTVRRTIEFIAADEPAECTVMLPESLMTMGNKLELHRGMLGGGHWLGEFAAVVDVSGGTHLEQMEWEIAARKTTVRICEYLKGHVPAFGSAVLTQASGELWHPPVFTGIEPGSGSLFVLGTDVYLAERQNVRVLMEMRRQAALTAERAAGRIAANPDSGLASPVYVKAGSLLLPVDELSPVERTDGWSGITYCSIQLENRHFESLPLLCECRVAVAGGGTAGAPATIGAAEAIEALKEAAGSAPGKSGVVVFDGSNGLGGTGTIGGINTYWFGYRGGFTAELDDKTAEMTRKISAPAVGKLWNIEAKMMTYVEEIAAGGAVIMLRTSAVGACVADRKINRVAVVNPDGLHAISAQMVVDATGDGDLAAFAGVPYALGDGRGGNLQTFNMCEWKARGIFAGVNLDIGVIDITNVFDLTRGIVTGHRNGNEYDFSSYPAVRESRHMECIYKLTVEDLLAQRTFPDVIAFGSTDFDQHSLQSSDFARLGYMPYHQDSKQMRVPLSACIPETVDNLLITGKAFSAERDAFSFMRMQPDLQNMGYAIGAAAAAALEQGRIPARISMEPLQSMLLRKGILRPQDLELVMQQQPEALIAGADKAEPFLQLLCMRKENALPALKQCFSKQEYSRVILPIAMALAWFGAADGVEELIAELRRLKSKEQHSEIDKGGRPVGGFIEEPGVYWRVNQLISVLGMTGDRSALPVLLELVEATDAGGPPLPHVRLHWRRIPNYDRIVALCQSVERLASREAAPAMEKLLSKPYIGGYAATGPSAADESYASAYLELVVARTAAKCGSPAGLRALISYCEDVRAVLSDHACSELAAVTGMSYGRSGAEWTERLGLGEAGCG